MASCAALRRPRRRLAWSSESAASPKIILSPLGFDISTRALLGTQPVMILPSASSSVSASFLGSTRIASTCVQSRLLSRITNSWPPSAWPSLAASLAGATRMVSSCTSVPLGLPAKALGENNKKLRRRKNARFVAKNVIFRSGKRERWQVFPIPPWSIGIIALRGKSEEILRLQRVEGKIFITRELAHHSAEETIEIVQASRMAVRGIESQG